jgi:hypothetical protein
MIVSRSWREFNKNQAIGLLSLYKKIWWIKPKFHLNINGYVDINWLNFVYEFVPKDNIFLYNDDFLKNYAISSGVDSTIVEKFSQWKWIYHILLYHYLWSVKGYNYIVTYDDDILFNEKPIDEIIGCINEKVPFAIGESQIFSDKPMFGRICNYFGDSYDINIFFWFCTNQDVSCNSGFMGVDNTIFARYKTLNDICSMFSYIPYKHRELLHYEDFHSFKNFFHGLLEEQSFLSINNKAFNPTTFITLREKDGYLIEYSEIKEGYSEKSKVEHYLGLKKYENLYESRVNMEFERLRILRLNNLGVEHFYDRDVVHPYK